MYFGKFTSALSETKQELIIVLGEGGGREKENAETPELPHS